VTTVQHQNNSGATMIAPAPTNNGTSTSTNTAAATTSQW